MDDPGKICLQGWTPGQLNNPRFNWVKNLTKKLDTDAVTTYQEFICSVFALCWNLSLKKMPTEVIEDFENFLTKTKTPRMKFDRKIPGFTIKLQNHQHTFFQQPFAPPSGQTAINYCRYIHKETNGTRYMILWYTERRTSTGEPIQNGGNFFFADYGVRVQNAQDTAISWEPRKAHGTSLVEKG